MAGLDELNTDVIADAAILGDDVHRDLKSPIVRAIIKLAAEEARQAWTEFLDVNPFDGDKVRHIQTRILRAREISEFITNAIALGDEAVAEYRRRKEGEGIEGPEDE